MSAREIVAREIHRRLAAELEPPSLTVEEYADLALVALDGAGYSVVKLEPIEVDNDDGAGGQWVDPDGTRRSMYRAPTKRVVGYRIVEPS